MDVIVTIDTDGQHDPADIPKLIEPILRGVADMVNGSRYMNGNKKDTPFYRRLGQVVLDNATRLDTALTLPTLRAVFEVLQHSRRIHSGLIKAAWPSRAKCWWMSNAGLRIKEVEIGVRYDVDGSSENPVSHGVKILIKILHDMELNRPLYYFTAQGSVMCVVGIGLGWKSGGRLIMGEHCNSAPLC